jgi:hypothetical protein
MGEPWDFFIAHAGPDLPTAERLANALKALGTRPFLDARKLTPGDSWPVDLKKALVASRVMVVLISPHSDEAYYQKEEVAIAIELLRAGSRSFRIVPVLLKGASRADLLYGLYTLHYLAEDAGGLDTVANGLVALLPHRKEEPVTVELAQATERMDEFWAHAEGAFGTEISGSLPKEFRHRYSAEGEDIVARSHGHEVKRITRAEFEQLLKPEDLEYIAVLEKSMDVNLALWRLKYPNRVLNPADRQVAEQALGAMGEDLSGVLDSLEDAGFALDDHYKVVRRVLKRHGVASRRPDTP